MKCPFGDGWEGTPEEYIRHYDEKHSGRKRPFGYRTGGEYGSREATSLIRHEVEELGNVDMVPEIAKALNCQPKLDVIFQEIRRRWPNPRGIWLCDSKRACKREYGQYSETGQVSKVTLPSNALVITSLEEEGKLYVYSGEEEWD